MSSPIVIAHHIMWTAYGWWLPNDPRGSTSIEVYTPQIAELAPLHFGRKRIQPASRDIRKFYQQARERLQFPLLKILEADRRAIACAFAESIAQHRYTCYACVIMPDHVHLLIRKHKQQAEEMIENLQHESRSRLSSDGLRVTDHPTWTKGGWKVFLDHPDEIWRTIDYIESNPDPWKLPRQSYEFVTKYDNWPLHAGHNPNSPYAKRLGMRGRS